MMKTVKIKYVGFWKKIESDEDAQELIYIHRILKKRYNVLLSNNPEYIITGCFDPGWSVCKYNNAIRILLADENVCPDFNLVDYAITTYPLSYLDRHFRKPVFVDADIIADGTIEESLAKRSFTKEWLTKKSRFCNFIVGHESEKCIRGNFFNELSKYKRVDSPGLYLNNMPGGWSVNREKGGKRSFQKSCKFSLCFESTEHTGFITEKIMDAFLAETVPVYFGDPNVTELFNKNAFLQYDGHSDMNALVNRIIELDQNEDAYLKMMNEPVFVIPNYLTMIKKQLEEFIFHIFDQSYDEAFRRSRIYWPKIYNDFYATYGSFYHHKEKVKKIIKPVRDTIANVAKKNPVLRDAIVSQKYGGSKK